MACIWIVEDDPHIGQLVEMLLQKDGHETLLVLDDVELSRALKKENRQPDLLLLDLMLRAKNGFQILREWKENQKLKNIPVIILSARSTEQDKVKGLELGAEDYITKPFGIRELQARVRTAIRRLPTKRDQLRSGGLVLLPASHECFNEEKRVELTAREFDLLLYLMRHAGQTVRRSEILKEVWGYATEDDVSRTVDSHIKTLRLKLGDSAGRASYIQTVRGVGYRLAAEDEK